MALRRPVAKALGCQNCQQWILRSFIAGVSGNSAQQASPFRQQRQAFSRISRRWNGARIRAQEEDHALNVINDEANEAIQEASTPASEPPSQNEHVPWYLQVQQPFAQQESPISARQRIPDLPEHPPSILQPLLEHVSVELGMDDLSLLDLRTLDPPPALGANLLMIVGTARSEKHLHVSADRLCRWLRSNHKLRPYADGLLGRNELKIKLRRKAKRTRLLSAVGAKATADTDVDDGIRTGWVCVNVGRVEGGELPENKEALERQENIIGFGGKTDGSSVVVQLMTEEKRGEIDLEKLWTDTLNRANSRTQKLQEQDEGGEENAEDTVISDFEQGNADPQLRQQSMMSSSYGHAASVSNHNTGQQIRAYHSTTPRRMASVYAATDTGSGANKMTHSSLNAGLEPRDESLIKMNQLLMQLKSLGQQEALETLGSGLLDASSQFCYHQDVLDLEEGSENVSFLRSFYSAMPAFPGPEHWHMHIELLVYARQIGYPVIHRPVLMAQLENMQLAGVIPEERTFKLLVHSLLFPRGNVIGDDGTPRLPGKLKINGIIHLLENMEACGYDPVSPDILATLYQACVGSPEPSQTLKLNEVTSALAAARMRRYVQASDWTSFWRTWRSYPQRLMPRTADMYKVLFDAIGDGRLQPVNAARIALSMYLEEIEREQPPVLLEQQHPKVAKSLMAALEFVDPALKNAAGNGGSNKEWRQWYERAKNVTST